jgi:deoxyribonucleoside regulator
MVEPAMVVGVAWGTTMAGVARHLQSRPLVDVTVVQLNGAAHPDNFGIGFVGDILDRFAEALAGRVEPLPVPAFFDDPATRRAMWRERSVLRILSLQGRMDVAVFGVGDPRSDIPGHVYRGGYLDVADHETLAEDRVVGDVATMFFRADGTHEGIRLNERSSGPDVDVLRRAPRRVCVVSDPSRIPAVRGALAADLVTDLIIDEQSARELTSTYVQDV